MLIFTNPGLIDIDAVTILGVSVKQPGSFGRFGTGLKFAIATVLRGGGSVTLWRGLQRFDFGIREKVISNQKFNIVTLAGDWMGAEARDLGITTMLGRDWKPWMVLRELACNALDEHGSFRQLLVGRARLAEFGVSDELYSDYVAENGVFSGRWPNASLAHKHTPALMHIAVDNVFNPIAQALKNSEGGVPCPPGSFDLTEDIGVAENQTTIVVHWSQLEQAYENRGNLFLTGEPVAVTEHLRVLAQPSQYLFYRGIRVFKLEHGSKFTYDILAEQRLTEDRTLLSDYIAEVYIQDFWLEQTNQDLLRVALTAGGYEGALNYESASWGKKPSREFLTVAADIRESDDKGQLNSSARTIVMKHQRTAVEEESVGGQSYRRIVSDTFNYAVDILKDLGIEFSDEQKFLEVPELPNDTMLTMLEGGRVYYVPNLLRLPARDLAEELLLRWVELNCKGYGMEDAAKLLAPFVVGRSKHLKHDEELVAEDAVMAATADDSEQEAEAAMTDEEAAASLAEEVN